MKLERTLFSHLSLSFRPSWQQNLSFSPVIRDWLLGVGYWILRKQFLTHRCAYESSPAQRSTLTSHPLIFSSSHLPKVRQRRINLIFVFCHRTSPKSTEMLFCYWLSVVGNWILCVGYWILSPFLTHRCAYESSPADYSSLTSHLLIFSSSQSPPKADKSHLCYLPPNFTEKLFVIGYRSLEIGY